VHHVERGYERSKASVEESLDFTLDYLRENDLVAETAVG